VAEAPGTAAIILEQGRGVLWAQTLDARGDDRLHLRAPVLAERLSQVRCALDANS
jgi:hypothetical protein